MPGPQMDKENIGIIKNCQNAARPLENAWGKGGSQGESALKKWDEWFQEFAAKIVDLAHLGKLSTEAEEAALNACAAILALDNVPHWSHPDDIALIRATLRVNQDWDDYPEKVKGGFDDDDDDF